MLLIYSHTITPRLKYVFKQVCTRILGIPVGFTSMIEEFIAHDSLKMTYSLQPLGNEFFIRSHNIIFEQGLSDIDITVHDWDDTKCFFYNGEKSAIPYDIFAASFYLLSRYEEYLPHVKDEYGRFNAKDSLAFNHNFLHQPVIDIWAYKFKDALKKRFPDYNFPERKYTIQPVIDVPMAFYFIQKGIMRTLGGTIGDIVRFKFKRLYQRYLVLFRIRGPDQHPVAFDQRELGRDDQLGLAQESAYLRRPGLSQQPADHRAGFRVETHVPPRSSSSNRAAVPSAASLARAG